MWVPGEISVTFDAIAAASPSDPTTSTRAVSHEPTASAPSPPSQLRNRAPGARRGARRLAKSVVTWVGGR